MQDSLVKFSDLLIIIATILGPILAVQAQKAVERFTEARARKDKIFYALMSTRMSRLSAEHIQALNSISLVFGSSKTFIFRRISKSEKLVLEAWDTYQDILNVRVEELNEPNFVNWVSRRDDKFNDLLLAMSDSLGFSFNKLQISRGAYSPIAQAKLEKNQQDILEGVAKLFRDGTPIPINISSIAHDADAIDIQRKVQDVILSAISEKGIPVKILNDSPVQQKADFSK